MPHDNPNVVEDQPQIGLRLVPEQVFDALRQLGEQYPDRRYEIPWDVDEDRPTLEQPVYSDQFGKPSCLVGHVLARLGLPVPEMSYHHGASRFHLGEWLQDHGVTVPNSPHNSVWDALCEAQEQQDARQPWGLSVCQALRVVGQPA
jgi:hypothetical protein